MSEMFYPDGEQTTAIPTAPDVYYIRTREDLLQYEDARFNGLIQAVANYYSTLNDQSLWGDFLRAISQELARLEYDYAYDVVNKSPIFLTPADIKRRYAAPLYINRVYPTLNPVQYDLGYKMMLVNLILAYFQGATVESLEAIITAYTGLNITVIELYKLIGQGVFDQSDRNTVSISVNVGGSNPLDDVEQLNQLQPITNALYGALDLGKPAHVGLDFKVVFGADEDLSAFVTQGTSETYDIVNSNGITDLLRIYIRVVEAEPFNPMLYQAPDLFAGTPRTGLGPSQVMSWQPNTIYVVGQIILANGFFQIVTTSGQSGVGPTSPVFNPTSGGHTSDGAGTLVWTNGGSAVGVILYPTNSTYNPDIAFSIFSTIIDPNGFIQIASVAGTSFPAWEQDTVYSLHQEIVDANGYIQKVTTAGTSGVSIIPSAPYYPPFIETVNASTEDGTVVWQTQGLYVWNTKLGGVTPDGSVIWVNIGPPPGLVAPRLLQAWEVKSDQLTIFETS
jgi:hypothetical protein